MRRHIGVTGVVMDGGMHEGTEHGSPGARRVPFPAPSQGMPRRSAFAGKGSLAGSLGCPTRCDKGSAPTPQSSPVSAFRCGRGGRMTAPPLSSQPSTGAGCPVPGRVAPASRPGYARTVSISGGAPRRLRHRRQGSGGSVRSSQPPAPTQTPVSRLLVLCPTPSSRVFTCLLHWEWRDRWEGASPFLSARADGGWPTPSSAIIGCPPSVRFGVDQWPRARRVANHGARHVAQSAPPNWLAVPAARRRGADGGAGRRGRSAGGSPHAQPSAKGSEGAGLVPAAGRGRRAVGVALPTPLPLPSPHRQHLHLKPPVRAAPQLCLPPVLSRLVRLPPPFLDEPHHYSPGCATLPQPTLGDSA